MFKARLVAIGVVCTGIAAAVILVRPISAQGRGDRGVFGTLAVGQMVEVRDAPVGVIIYTYEDPAFKANMAAKVVEIGPDFIALETAPQDNGLQTEMRYPLHAVGAIGNIRGKFKQPPTTTPSKTPSKTDTTKPSGKGKKATE